VGPRNHHHFNLPAPIPDRFAIDDSSQRLAYTTQDILTLKGPGEGQTRTYKFAAAGRAERLSFDAGAKALVVAFQAGTGLYVFDLENPGGLQPPRMIRTNSKVQDWNIGPVGSRVAWVDSGQVELADLASNSAEPIQPLPVKGLPRLKYQSVAFSPDGSLLAVGDNSGLVVLAAVDPQSESRCDAPLLLEARQPVHQEGRV